MLRALIEYGPPESLGYAPPQLIEWTRSWQEEQPAAIRVTGDPEPDLLADVDSDLIGRARSRELRAINMKLALEGYVNWAIVAYPNAGWAQAVFGEPDVERLWTAVAQATRLDADRPGPPAQAHLEQARAPARPGARRARHFDAVRFRGPGTDLTVGLIPRTSWMSGAATSSGQDPAHDRRTCLTEEVVHDAPTGSRVDGTVR